MSDDCKACDGLDDGNKLAIDFFTGSPDLFTPGADRNSRLPTEGDTALFPLDAAPDKPELVLVTAGLRPPAAEVPKVVDALPPGAGEELLAVALEAGDGLRAVRREAPGVGEGVRAVAFEAGLGEGFLAVAFGAGAREGLRAVAFEAGVGDGFLAVALEAGAGDGLREAGLDGAGVTEGFRADARAAGPGEGFRAVALEAGAGEGLREGGREEGATVGLEEDEMVAEDAAAAALAARAGGMRGVLTLAGEGLRARDFGWGGEEIEDLGKKGSNLGDWEVVLCEPRTGRAKPPSLFSNSFTALSCSLSRFAAPSFTDKPFGGFITVPPPSISVGRSSWCSTGVMRAHSNNAGRDDGSRRMSKGACKFGEGGKMQVSGWRRIWWKR
ncbi:hypothetical protein R1sor_006081 [Riccia sorocarpa]|uniref:Uncharacterized protein n=1 Tax=Riccia sorocarpa TaxID=122646 RepID=A0ABD3HLD4_9MARC